MITPGKYLSYLNTRWVLLLLLSLQAAMHMPWLNRPPMGNHVWRQCNTLAVARNYAEEDMRIWLPRIDKRYKFDGVTGPSFTAYEYGLAVLYRTFGFSHSLHRYYSLIISLLAVWGLFALTRLFVKSNQFAAISALSLISIPEFFYHSINAVPDILALTFMLWGWYFMKIWMNKGEIAFWLPASILLSLAGMVKLQFLICGIPIAADWLRSKNKGLKFIILTCITLLLVCGSAFAWYRYANYLTFHNWLNEFVHAVRFPASVREFITILKGNLLSDLFETWVGYPLLPPLVAGLYLLLFRKSMHVRLTVILTVLAVAVIYMLLQRQFLHHGYYTLFMAPFLAMAAAVGFEFFQKHIPRWAWVFFLFAPLWALFRMSHNWEWKNSRIPNSLLGKDAEIRKLTDTSKRYIVGPDQTGCVYFYFTRAKGYPWYHDLEKADVLAEWVRWGAEGIITDKPGLLMMESDSLVLKQTGRVGEFYWFDVKTVNP